MGQVSNLDLLSSDTTLANSLAGQGYRSIASIASTPCAEFVRSTGAILDAARAERLHAGAQAQYMLYEYNGEHAELIIEHRSTKGLIGVSKLSCADCVGGLTTYHVGNEMRSRVLGTHGYPFPNDQDIPSYLQHPYDSESEGEEPDVESSSTPDDPSEKKQEQEEQENQIKKKRNKKNKKQSGEEAVTSTQSTTPSGNETSLAASPGVGTVVGKEVQGRSFLQALSLLTIFFAVLIAFYLLGRQF